jgi:hypothetical protein
MNEKTDKIRILTESLINIPFPIFDLDVNEVVNGDEGGFFIRVPQSKTWGAILKICECGLQWRVEEDE